LGIILNKIFFTAFILLLSFFQTSTQERAKSAHVPLTAGVDWIYFATCALYSKWEAEGDNVFGADEPVGMKPQFGCPADNNSAWSTGTDSANVNRVFFLGPHYTQYTNYGFSHKYNDNAFVKYTANFRLRTTINPVDTVPVCRLSVVVKDSNYNYIGTLREKIIYSNLFDTGYRNFKLRFDYSDLFYTQDITSLPEMKVHFQIEWFGNYELLLDYVEVYDIQFYENFFINICRYVFLIHDLKNFSAKGEKGEDYEWPIAGSYMYDRIEPILQVQAIFDSLNIDRNIIRDYYPYLSFRGIRSDETTPKKAAGEAHLLPGKIIMKND
jgi:hypothetical protein